MKKIVSIVALSLLFSVGVSAQEKKTTKKEKAKTEKKAECSKEEKKSCGTEAKGSCCSKKAKAEAKKED